MANNSLLKRLLDAGVTLGEVTQTKADELVSILRDSGVKRKEAEKTVMDLADQARAQTDKFVARIKSELAEQIVAVADRLDNLEDKIEDLAEKAAGMLLTPQEAAATVRGTPSSGKPAKAAATASAKATPAKKRAGAKKAAKKQATATAKGTAKATATAAKATPKKTTKKTAKKTAKKAVKKAPK